MSDWLRGLAKPRQKVEQRVWFEMRHNDC